MNCAPIRIVQNNLVLNSALTSTPPTVTDINNCKLARRSKIVRWDDIDSTCTFSIQFDDVAAIDTIAVLNHNLSNSGSMQIRAYDSTNTIVYESPQMTFGAELPAWGVEFTWGIDPLGIATTDGLPPLAAVFFEQQNVYRIEIDFNNSSNAMGAIQFQHVFVGLSLSPEINFTYGWNITESNGLEYAETDGGSLFPVNLPRIRRNFSIPHEWINYQELHRLLADRRVYADKPIFVSLFPAGTSQDLKTFSMLARMSESNYTSPMYQNFTTNWEFTEL